MTNLATPTIPTASFAECVLGLPELREPVAQPSLEERLDEQTTTRIRAMKLYDRIVIYNPKNPIDHAFRAQPRWYFDSRRKSPWAWILERLA